MDRTPFSQTPGGVIFLGIIVVVIGGLTYDAIKTHFRLLEPPVVPAQNPLPDPTKPSGVNRENKPLAIPGNLGESRENVKDGPKLPEPTKRSEGSRVNRPLAVAGKLEESRENVKDGLKYVWIPPGTFMMGCSRGDTECEDSEKPAHQVTIMKGFWLGRTEATVGAYKRFTKATGRQMPPEPTYHDEHYVEQSLNPGWGNEAMPIVEVTWDDAQAYCSW